MLKHYLEGLTSLFGHQIIVVGRDHGQGGWVSAEQLEHAVLSQDLDLSGGVFSQLEAQLPTPPGGRGVLSFTQPRWLAQDFVKGEGVIYHDEVHDVFEFNLAGLKEVFHCNLWLEWFEAEGRRLVTRFEKLA